MSTTLQPSNVLLRQVVATANSTRILELIEVLDLTKSPLGPTVLIPLRNLRLRRDVVAFATRAPLTAIRAVVEVLGANALEQVVDRLGESAESPTYEELRDVIDELLSTDVSTDEILAVLALAVADSFPAAPHCERLLSERIEFALVEISFEREVREEEPTLDVDREEIRARRRERRANKKPTPPFVRSARRAASAKKASPPTEEIVEETPRVEAVEVSVPDSVPVSVPVTNDATYRELRLTPREEKKFSRTHSLVGYVVYVDIPFEETDPSWPEIRSKVRPVLVVAGSRSSLLVRPIYSHEATRREFFAPWERLGLDHPSYIDLERFQVDLIDIEETARRGPLSVEEWNLLN